MDGSLWKHFNIKKFKKGSLHPEEDSVVIENPLTIMLNGFEILTLQITPQYQEELATGFLFGEGFIESAKEITHFKFNSDLSVIDVETKNEKKPDLSRMGKRVMSSGCGRGFSFSSKRQREKINTLPPGPIFPAKIFFELMGLMEKEGEVFSKTGGTHSAALGDKSGNLLFACEDIGRHNAVDKVFGWAGKNGFPLEDKVLVCSGRISSEMVTKALVNKVRVVVSRSAPTSQGVERAREFNLTLIGFCRGPRFNLYTGEERVKP